MADGPAPAVRPAVDASGAPDAPKVGSREQGDLPADLPLPTAGDRSAGSRIQATDVRSGESRNPRADVPSAAWRIQARGVLTALAAAEAARVHVRLRAELDPRQDPGPPKARALDSRASIAIAGAPPNLPACGASRSLRGR